MKKIFTWSKTSTVILSVFFITLFLIGYVWWPLLSDYINQVQPEIPIWQQVDWLLIGNFLVMSVLITLNADLRQDIPFVLIALAGGFIIEAWGTLSGLWTYYTFETPPLWIIPAWPIAALSVNRLYRLASNFLRKVPEKWFRWSYPVIFSVFLILLFNFVWPSIMHPLSLFALAVCLMIIFTCKDKRSAVLILLVGSLLGYFLERWGTTRLCWTYYIGGTPPFFTVIAHGMASLAIWQVYQYFLWVVGLVNKKWLDAISPENIR